MTYVLSLIKDREDRGSKVRRIFEGICTSFRYGKLFLGIIDQLAILCRAPAGFA